MIHWWRGISTQGLVWILALASSWSGLAAESVRTNPIDGLIGKLPPPLIVGAWIQGGPIRSWQPGKVYVIDFWATWCGPCRAAIPRLTRLSQRASNEVEVIGVSISETQETPEDTAYVQRVRSFVRKMGDQMTYPVAVDTVDRRMHSTWFKPTGTGGIPTAYILDRTGRVAWAGIGDPAVVDRIVSEVLAGTFDYARESARQQQAEAEALSRSAADIEAARKRASGTDAKYPGYRAAMERGDSAAALASLNAAFAAEPSSEITGAYQWKLMLLLQRNRVDPVNDYARELIAKHGTNDDIMSFLSACIVATSEEARFDTKLAWEAAKRSADAAKPDSRWQQFARWRLGWAYYHLGNRAKAVESVRAALAGIHALKGRIEFDNLEGECSEALRVMQSAAR